MLYSHTSELAIRATLYLALQPPGKLSPIREIARDTRLSAPYLAKIMRRLISAGLVRAFRGPGGGLELAHAPENVTLWSVVHTIDGAERTERCVLGLRACSEENPCALHRQWFPLRAEIQRLLEETTLAHLTQSVREKSAAGAQAWQPVSKEDAEEFSQSPRRRSS